MKILLYYYFWSLNLIGLAAYSSSTELSGMKQLTELTYSTDFINHRNIQEQNTTST